MSVIVKFINALAGSRPLERERLPLPKLCGIKITDRCNLRCRHCNLYEHQSKEMSSEEVRKLIDALRHYEFRDVVFAGGEPFLRKDLMDLINYAVGRELHVHVCTNCSLLNRETVKRLVDMNVKFWLSLDGSNPEVHAAVRGKSGNWEQVVQVMRWLEEMGAPICIKTVLMRENMDDQAALVEFLRGFKGVELRHDPANVMRLESGCPAPGVKTSPTGELIWSDYEDAEVVRKICDSVDKLAAMQRDGESIIKTPPAYWRGIKAYVRGETGNRYGCDLTHLSSMPINSNGDVSLCGTWISGDYIVGNVVKENYDLEKIWNGERAWNARERSRTCQTPCWIDDRFECKEEKHCKIQERYPETLETMSITRWKLLNWMAAEVDRVKPTGRVLEIGSTMSLKYMFRNASEFITSDPFYPESWHPKGQTIDRKEDVTHLSFADNTFDVLICHQVLEHVDDLHAAAREMHRVLKPGGILWFSSPFIDHHHPTPKDYWRISRDGYAHLFRHFSQVEIEEFGNMKMYEVILSKEMRKDWDPDEFGPPDPENPLQLFGRAVK